MSKYDDTFRELLYQLTETSTSKKTCPSGEVWDPKQEKCVKKKDRWPDSGGVPHGGINEGGMPGHMEIPTITPNQETWKKIKFEQIGLHDLPDRKTWSEPKMKIHADDDVFIVYDVADVGTVLVTQSNLSQANLFRGSTSNELADHLVSPLS